MVIDDEVHGAWQRVTEAWDDPAEHDKLFERIVQHGSFAWAAARYRERGDDAVATQQLERLRKAALATMMVTATARRSKERTPYKSTLIVLVGLLIALLVAMLVTESIRDNRTPVTKPARR